MIFNRPIVGTVVNAIMILGLVGLGCSASKKPESDNPDLPPDSDSPSIEAKTDAVPVTDADHQALDTPAVAEATPAESPKDASSEQPKADVATATPAPDAPPAAQQSTTVGFEDYTIQEGDTLMKIAFENYGDLFQWKKIYEDNKDKIQNPNSLAKGNVLKLEKPGTPVVIERNGEKYTIKGGDTLGAISDDIYGTKSKWKKLWENNKQLIHDPNRIFAGFYLYYTMTPEERDAADKLKQNRPQKPAPLAEKQEVAPAPGEAPDVSGNISTDAVSAIPAVKVKPLIQMDDLAASVRAPAGSGAGAAE